MLIRALKSNEVFLHRETRLRALQQAPDAFGQSFDDVACRPISFWVEQTEAVTAPGRNIMFLAREGDAVLGMIYGLRDPTDVRAGRLGGMWVDPLCRCEGVGNALLEAVISWALAQNMTCLGLWVSVPNVTAISFYRLAGFSETDKQGFLNEDRCIQTIEMIYNL
ncbi:MAG: GNAT family N-acetyltransferase [Alphaproteobacteria bacterium]|nr:GNAT family N-acetyltransferase [Alphaproteobacteria bacterium]